MALPCSLLLLATLSQALAGGDTGGEPAELQAAQGTVSSASDDLDAAIDQYLDGNLEEARLALIRLARDPRLEEQPALRRRVRVYLGEVLYVMGDRDTAWETFVSVVIDDPGYQMDPFVHPPDVITFFESAREYASRLLPPVEDDDPAPVRVTDPPPGVLGSLTPGRLQFYNDQPLLGALTIGAVTLTGGGAVGLGLYVRAQDDNASLPGVNLLPSRADERATLEALKDAKNVSMGVAAGVWSLAVLQGALRASRTLAGSDGAVELRAAPQDGGASASLTFRW